MNKIKVSVIGVGHLGSIHAKLLSSNLNAEFVGIRDIDRIKSQKISNEFKCKDYDSLDETLNDSEAVIIAVPTSLHHEIAMQSIEAGKHCLIEKPITENYSQALELIKFAKEKNVLLQVGHVERFNPAIAALKNYDIRPLFIESHRLAQFKPRARDVSVIHDLMIHDIDIVLWLVKSPFTGIDASGIRVLSDTIDIANARLKFANGATANITASRISAHPMRKMRIFQEGAYLSLDFQEQTVDVFRIYDEGENSTEGVPATNLGSIETGLRNKNIFFEKPVVIPINAIAEEQQAFLDAINHKSPIAVNADEASEALRVAEIIIEIIGKD
jgi:predicted dehydrogenase